MNHSDVVVSSTDYKIFDITRSDGTATAKSVSACIEYLFNASKYMVGAAIFPAALVSVIGFGVGAAVADNTGCKEEETEADRESCVWDSSYTTGGAGYGALSGGATALFFASCKVAFTGVQNREQLTFRDGVSDSCKVLNTRCC